jgi:hypothetical protein
LSSYPYYPPAPIYGYGVPEEGEAQEPFNFSPLALVGAVVVKSGPGQLFDFSVLNTNAATRYIQLYDQISLPASGAVPIRVYSVATAVTLDPAWATPMAFRTGIVIANSTTSATYTAGSADQWIYAQYL